MTGLSKTALGFSFLLVASGWFFAPFCACAQPTVLPAVGGGAIPSSPEAVIPPPSAPSAAAASSTGPAPIAPGGTAEARRDFFVRDEMGYFKNEQRAEMEAMLVKLYQETKRAIFVLTRFVNDIQSYETISKKAFQKLVKEEGHARIFLIIFMYDQTRNRGMVSTSVGAGLSHVLGREEALRLFIQPDQRFDRATAVTGLRRLCNSLIDYHRQDLAASQRVAKKGGIVRLRTWALRQKGIIIAVLVGLLIAAFLFWREVYCPQCWGALRTSVYISYSPFEGHRIGRKTYKCFRCGYVGKRDLLPSIFWRLLQRRPRGRLADTMRRKSGSLKN